MSELFDIGDVPVLYVDSEALLKSAVEAFGNADVLAVDTEFIRVSTFFPKLALLQIFDGEQIYLIDAPAISCGRTKGDASFDATWSDLSQLFSSENVVKIFHACEEDLELLYYYWGVLPAAIFDTQLACGFVGLDYPMGYQKLVEEMSGEHVEKGDSRSDWLQRPLTESQLRYAAFDVLYLIDIHSQLQSLLEQKQQVQRFAEDCHLMIAALLNDDYSQAYLKFKSHVKLAPEPLWRLQQLCVWRETMMRENDLPRKKIAHNDALMLLAKKGRSASSYLYRIEGLPGATVKKHEATLLALLEAVPDVSELECFNQRTAIDPRQLKQLQKTFKLKLQAQAQSEGISEQVMVKKAWMEAYVLQLVMQVDYLISPVLIDLEGSWRADFYQVSVQDLLA